MNLLQKLTSYKKENKIDNYFDFFLNSQIKNLKNHIHDLSQLRRKDQKKLREEKVKLIFKELYQIEPLYNAFNKDLSNFIKMKNENISTYPDINEKIFLMSEKKKSLHNEFEKIYINFKHMAIHMEDIPFNEIKKKMLKAFKLDGKPYHYFIEQKTPSTNHSI